MYISFVIVFLNNNTSFYNYLEPNVGFIQFVGEKFASWRQGKINKQFKREQKL